MWKGLVVGAVAMAIGGSTLVYAQQSSTDRDRGTRWRPSTEDVSALSDGRVAGIKAALKLTADQEKHWPAFEQALRDRAKQRFERVAARRNRNDSQRPADMIERLQRRADMMSSRAADLKKFADAAAPLYQSLDDGQKKRFSFLVRSMNGGRKAFGRAHHRWNAGERR